MFAHLPQIPAVHYLHCFIYRVLKKQPQIFTIVFLTVCKRLIPAFPDIRLISQRRLLSISHYRSFQNLGIFQHLCKLVFLYRVFNECEQILVLSFPVDHIFQAAIYLSNGIKFSLTHTLFLHINKLVLNPSLFEKSLCFLRVIAFLRTKYLYVHIRLSLLHPSLPSVPFSQKTVRSSVFSAKYRYLSDRYQYYSERYQFHLTFFRMNPSDPSL